MTLPRRVRFALACPVVVAAGLASRSAMAPAVVREWAGDPLYAVLIYLLVRVVSPAPDTALRAGILAWLVCVGVEVSQLWPALDPVRATRLGALVLGRGFLWSDVAAYAVGVAGAYGGEWVVARGILRE